MAQPQQMSTMQNRSPQSGKPFSANKSPSATMSDAFVSIGCASVRRYANQHTVYPMWPQGLEKSRIQLHVVCTVNRHHRSPLSGESGNTLKDRSSRTVVRMCIRTCDGVVPSCSVEFATRWQNVIPEFWERATLIRASELNVVSETISSLVTPAEQNTLVSIPAVTILLTFDVRRDAKLFEDFLANVFESESGLMSKSRPSHSGGLRPATTQSGFQVVNKLPLQSSGKEDASNWNSRSHRGLNDKTAGNAQTSKTKKSCFDERTDESSSSQYFQFYSYLSQQQNMLQDYLRTATYQRAILSNMLDFLGKTVMDVGAGSGILSFFAVQAGARKVYAVEASSMAVHCRRLIEANGLQDKIICINKKVEEIDSLGPGGELVDIIISEPLGYMLVNERMLETYLHAKKFLKPGGNMYPSQADLHCAPFCDESLYMEQLGKANFWHQNNFYGIDLSSLRSAAFEENFRQPIVDTFDMRILMAPSMKYTIDFLKANEDDLHRIHVPVEFIMHHNGTVHGLCFWFDAAFRGSEKTVWLSTAPSQPLTHWYQVRCLLQQPLYCIKGQMLYGSVTLTANARQSYDIEIVLTNSTTGSVATNQLDLKSPCFRMFAAAAVASASTTSAAVSSSSVPINNNVIMQQSTTSLPVLYQQQQQQSTSSAAVNPYAAAVTGGGPPPATNGSVAAMPLNSGVMFVAGNSTNYNLPAHTFGGSTAAAATTATSSSLSTSQGNSIFRHAGSSGSAPSTSSSAPFGGGGGGGGGGDAPSLVNSLFQTPFRFISSSPSANAACMLGGDFQQQQQQQVVISCFNDLILQQQQQQLQQATALAAAAGLVVVDGNVDESLENTSSVGAFNAGGFPGPINYVNNNGLTAANGNIISAMADVVITSSPNVRPTFPAPSAVIFNNNTTTANTTNSSAIGSSKRGMPTDSSSSTSGKQSLHHNNHHHHRHRHYHNTHTDGVSSNNSGSSGTAGNGETKNGQHHALS